MVIKRSFSTEVARLLDALLSADPNRREAAAARLAILGSRAVERLASTLPGLREPAHITAVLDVLERIGDARGVTAAEPLVADPRDPVALGAIAVLRRALQADDPEIAARATTTLLAVASDPARSSALRKAAREGLADLPEDIVGPLHSTAPALPPDAEPARGEPEPEQDGQAWLTAWAEGAEVPASPDRVRVAVQAHAPSAPLATLHDAVEQVRRRERETSGEVQGAWRTTRGLVHQALAARASRVALYDLRETIERDPDQLTVAMLSALATIGDASCVDAIAHGWAHTHDQWIKAQLCEAFVTICARERLTRRHAAVRRVAAHQPELVAGLSTPSRTTPSRPRSRHT